MILLTILATHQKTQPYYFFDRNQNTFQCFTGYLKIPLSKYNDSVCDCCDGSDEIENPSVTCRNTCKIDISLFNESTINRFKNAIELSKANRQLTINKRNDFSQLESQGVFNVLYYQNLLSSCIYDYNYYTYKLNKMVEMLNITIDPNEFWDDKYLTEEKILKEDAIAKAIGIKNFTFILEYTHLLYLYLKSKENCSTYAKYINESTNIVSSMRSFLRSDFGENDEFFHSKLNIITMNFTSNGKNYTFINYQLDSISLISEGITETFEKVARVRKLFIYKSNLGKKFFLLYRCGEENSPPLFGNLDEHSYYLSISSPIVCPTEYSNDNLISFFREE